MKYFITICILWLIYRHTEAYLTPTSINWKVGRLILWLYIWKPIGVGIRWYNPDRHPRDWEIYKIWR